MQNSLERIFEGLQHTLRAVVAPSITDPYLHSQLTSVAEIVGNLSTRVEWSCAALREVSLRIRPVLDRAVTVPAADLPLTRELLRRPAPGTDADNAALLHARDEHLRALREVQRSAAAADDDVDAAIRGFLDWQVATEAALLRTGMFSAPKTREVMP